MYSLESLHCQRRGSSNECHGFFVLEQSMKNNEHSSKPKFFCSIKVGSNLSLRVRIMSY